LFDGVWLLVLGRSDEKFRGFKDPEKVSSVRRIGPKKMLKKSLKTVSPVPKA
jgi:hypothetical protein